MELPNLNLPFCSLTNPLVPWHMAPSKQLNLKMSSKQVGIHVCPMCTFFGLYPACTPDKSNLEWMTVPCSTTFRWHCLGLGPLLCEQEEVGGSPTGAEHWKFAGGWIKCYMIYDFSTTLRDPPEGQWHVNGYYQVEGLGTFWAETFYSFALESCCLRVFVCRIPKWQLLRWMLQWATFQDSSRSIMKGFICCGGYGWNDVPC